MPTFLPKDIDGAAVPALGFKPGGAHSIAFSNVSAANTAAFSSTTEIVSLYATAPVYLAFGDSSVTAGTADHYFPSGLYYDVAVAAEKRGGFTHVAALRAETDGTLYISEKF